MRAIVDAMRVALDTDVLTPALLVRRGAGTAPRQVRRAMRRDMQRRNRLGRVRSGPAPYNPIVRRPYVLFALSKSREGNAEGDVAVEDGDAQVGFGGLAVEGRASRHKRSEAERT